MSIAAAIGAIVAANVHATNTILISDKPEFTPSEKRETPKEEPKKELSLQEEFDRMERISNGYERKTNAREQNIFK